MDSSLLAVLVLTYAAGWTSDRTFVVVTLGRLVPSSVQSSAEGLRTMFMVLGMFVGALVCPHVYAYNEYAFLVLGMILMVLMWAIISRRNELKDLSVVEKVDEEEETRFLAGY